MINGTLDDSSMAYYSYYFADRKFWDPYDPQLVSEALYSIGMCSDSSKTSSVLIFAYFSNCHLVRAHLLHTHCK